MQCALIARQSKATAVSATEPLLVSGCSCAYRVRAPNLCAVRRTRCSAQAQQLQLAASGKRQAAANMSIGNTESSLKARKVRFWLAQGSRFKPADSTIWLNPLFCLSFLLSSLLFLSLNAANEASALMKLAAEQYQLAPVESAACLSFMGAIENLIETTDERRLTNAANKRGDRLARALIWRLFGCHANERLLQNDDDDDYDDYDDDDRQQQTPPSCSKVCAARHFGSPRSKLQSSPLLNLSLLLPLF